MGPAERAVRFIENLTHTGDYAGRPFILRPWQRSIVERFFGELRADGTRRHTKVFLALPRKQGKTELVAAISLYLLIGQGKPQRRIYVGSGDRQQASLIFRAAKTMIQADPLLSRIATIHDGEEPRIVYPDGDSEITVVSSIPKTKYGYGPTDVLLDELHICTDALVKALTTGFAARTEPSTWMITTAGDDMSSYCFDEWEYAKKVRDGVVDDPSYLPVIYAADESDVERWDQEDVWHKAMPALGDFCRLDQIREDVRAASQRPRLKDQFLQLQLNVWVKRRGAFLDSIQWRSCDPVADEPELIGRPCFAGLDLSQTRDLTALALVFPDDDGAGSDVLCRFWAPSEGVWREEAESKRLYPGWAEQGWLTLHDGPVIDYAKLETEIVEDLERYRPSVLGSDPAGGWQLCQRLSSSGHNVKFIRQTFLMLNGPTREIERLVISGGLRHGDNPVLSWCAANAVAEANKSGLVMMAKGVSRGRIDGMSALANAFAAMMGEERTPRAGSVYDDRGMLTL